MFSRIRSERTSEPVDQTGHPDEHVVEQDRRVGQDDPLGARVADVALVPQRLVLERGLGVAAQEPGETGDPLRTGSGCACGASPTDPLAGTERRCCRCSASTTYCCPIIRSHWAIENSLHWVMDMIFRDDECRVRTDHAPANFATIKHMAHNLIKAPGKASVRLKRKAAGWDDDFLAEMIKR